MKKVIFSKFKKNLVFHLKKVKFIFHFHFIWTKIIFFQKYILLIERTSKKNWKLILKKKYYYAIRYPKTFTSSHKKNILLFTKNYHPKEVQITQVWSRLEEIFFHLLITSSEISHLKVRFKLKLCSI